MYLGPHCHGTVHNQRGLKMTTRSFGTIATKCLVALSIGFAAHLVMMLISWTIGIIYIDPSQTPCFRSVLEADLGDYSLGDYSSYLMAFLLLCLSAPTYAVRITKWFAVLLMILYVVGTFLSLLLLTLIGEILVDGCWPGLNWPSSFKRRSPRDESLWVSSDQAITTYSQGFFFLSCDTQNSPLGHLPSGLFKKICVRHTGSWAAESDQLQRIYSQLVSSCRSPYCDTMKSG